MNVDYKIRQCLLTLTLHLTDNLVKSIGKAGKAVTKRIGKTLTSIGESSDQRGLKRIVKAQNPGRQSLHQNGQFFQSKMKLRTGGDEGTF
jgi:hypothetical protein